MPSAQVLLDIVYPRVCCGCGNGLDGTEASGLCWDCRSGSHLIGPPWCDLCGMAVAGRLDHAFVCADCREEPPAFRQARSLYRYEGGVREAIHALKYRRDFSVVPDLARLMVAGLHTHFDDPDSFTLVPVPLHWKRRSQREFNQGKELVKAMQRLEPGRRKWCGLRRVKNTQTQTRLSRAGRKANVRNAFKVRSRRPLPGRILLIDDVMTTGATLNAAARALTKAGAEDVCALTLARG
jgi:ComF family protein